MGQYWQLINLDKKQTFGCWGEIKPIFLQRLPSAVVPFLVVPTTPLNLSVPNASRIGSWAGDRIICLGHYTSQDDHPNGMLTDDELVTAKEKSLYDTALESYQQVPIVEFPHEYSAAFPQHKSWVLRNLSKQQYLRADTFKTATTTITGPEVVWGQRSLGDVLLSRVTWSSDHEDGLKERVADFTCGVWAGDRFDITTMDVLEKSEGWEDVSVRFAKKVREIWRVCNRGMPIDEWS